MPKRVMSAVRLGGACVVVGGLFLLLPWGWAKEVSVGLHWLFHARGHQAAPADVVIIAIDKAVSEALDAPYEPKQWPRTVHAQLVEELRKAGVRTMVFDLLFRQERGAEDDAFVAAVEAAGNVLLLEFLEKRELGVAGSGADGLNAALHRLVPPAAPIAAAAVATAPFTLPKVPLQVAQFWTFDRNAGDAASLPLLAMLVHARSTYSSFWKSVEGIVPELAAQLPSSGKRLAETRAFAQVAELLASAVRQRPELPEEILRQTCETGDAAGVRTDRSLLESVLAALADPPSRYLNFYGPPLTVRTISYDAALRELSGNPGPGLNPSGWAGRAVFVGFSSPVQWEQQDEFITAFSDPETGHDLSGIEILATAFANLLERTSLQPLPYGYALSLVLGWGLLVGLLSRMLTPTWAVVLLLLLCAAYFYAALRLFSEAYLWLPLVTPLVVQTPLALFVATTLHYREAKRDRMRIREIFRYYLPDPVVERLVREGFHPTQDRESVFGVCLHSDGAQYTTLSEGMDPAELAAFMDAYYEVIFEPVRAHDGVISDVVGDAMMAIWAAGRDDLAIRTAACRAALEMLDAVERRNAGSDGPLLPTRVGLHCGAMALAHVGARNHFEYRAVGDIVNTASRLQELNKPLGSRLLASGSMIEAIENLVTQHLGSFLLAGKSQPIVVYLLLGWGEERRDATRTWRGRVDQALQAFSERDWDGATSAFRGLLDDELAQGLAQFYLAKIDGLRRSPPEPGWACTVRVSK